MDDPLRNRQGPAPLKLQSSFVTAIYDGPLLDAADLFGRPGGHPFGIGALSPLAQVPVFTNAPPPEPQVYEREVKGELQRAKDRVTQAAPQVQARVHADIERREVFTGPLIDFSPVGRIATRLVVIDGLVEETGQQLAWWQPRAAQFYGRDIWQTTAQDFIAHVQAAGLLARHATAQQAVGQWRQTLAAGEQTQLRLMRVAVLNELRIGAMAELQVTTGQAHGEHPAGWQQQVDSARPSSDQLLDELPNFLNAQVTGQSQINALSDPVDYLSSLRGHIDQILQGLPPLPPQPFLDSFFTQPPLVKSELDVLLEIVEDHRRRGLNNQFTRAREFILRSESIRHLQELSIKLEAIRTATVNSLRRLTEYQAQQAALTAELERQAAEQAERDREAQLAQEQADAAAAELKKRLQEQARQASIAAANARLEAWRKLPGALAVNVPQLQGAAPVVMAAGAAISFPAIEGASLGAAVRAAIAALGRVAGGIAASATVLLSGLAVGFIALLWPSSLAPSERRGAVLLPFGVLPGPDAAAIDSAVQSGQPVALPFAVTVRSEAEGVRLNVIAASDSYPICAQVIDLAQNPETGAYQAVIDTPPRLINVTPVVQPGNPSTELPIVDPGPAVQPGPALEVQQFGENVTPGYEALDVEIYILRYPEHTGLPALYLAVERPAVEIGEVENYDDLAKRSVGDGLDIEHIPSRKALAVHILAANPRISEKDLRKILDRGAAIAIPREVHQKYSETYGGRNTKEKSNLDGTDLRTAVLSNLNALRLGILEAGVSADQLPTITEALHEINQQLGFYK